MKDPVPTSANKSKKAFDGSAVLWALTLLLVVNGLLIKWQPLAKVDPDSLPAAHTWVWWATKDLGQQKQAPDVVVLGSSFLMQPIAFADADYLKHSFDLVHHHDSRYMENLLKQGLGIDKAECFNFAIPGGVVSDDYMIVRALLSGDKKPKVLVVGLGLRDFTDKHVTCAAATPPFKFLRRFTSVDDLVDLSMPQIWQRLDYWQGKACYLWGKKLDLQVVACDQVRNWFQPVVDKFVAKSPLSDVDMTCNAPANLRIEAEEGMFILKPNEPYKFDDNSREYAGRYQNGTGWLLGNQKKWLEKLLQLAHDKDIQVLFVNMPVTAENMQLMKPGAYQEYMATITEVSNQWHVPLVDLNGGTGYGNKFDKFDFCDTAHMNGRGGKKLIDAIASAICGNKQLAGALTKYNKVNVELAGVGNGYIQH